MLLAANIKRFFTTDVGRFLISVMLGFGVASLFRKACDDKNCMTFHGPAISEVEGKTFIFDSKCFEYVAKPATCSEAKKTITIAEVGPNTAPSLIGGQPVAATNFSWMPFS